MRSFGGGCYGVPNYISAKEDNIRKDQKATTVQFKLRRMISSVGYTTGSKIPMLFKTRSTTTRNAKMTTKIINFKI